MNLKVCCTKFKSVQHEIEKCAARNEFCAARMDELCGKKI